MCGLAVICPSSPATTLSRERLIHSVNVWIYVSVCAFFELGKTKCNCIGNIENIKLIGWVDYAKNLLETKMLLPPDVFSPLFSGSTNINAQLITNPLYLYSYNPLNFILLTCNVSTSSINCQLPLHPLIIKSSLHNDT
jgi:uncharacterized membrane protein